MSRRSSQSRAECKHGLPPAQCAYCTKSSVSKSLDGSKKHHSMGGFKRPLGWWIRYGQIERDYDKMIVGEGYGLKNVTI